MFSSHQGDGREVRAALRPLPRPSHYRLALLSYPVQLGPQGLPTSQKSSFVKINNSISSLSTMATPAVTVSQSGSPGAHDKMHNGLCLMPTQVRSESLHCSSWELRKGTGLKKKGIWGKRRKNHKAESNADSAALSEPLLNHAPHPCPAFSGVPCLDYQPREDKSHSGHTYSISL